MIVTEEEAANKLCPEFPDTTPCVGSECMAWQWEDSGKGLRDANIPRKGFCGKAGFPLEILDEA